MADIFLSASVYLFVEVPKYGRSSAPDVMIAKRDRVKIKGEPVPVSALTLVVLGRHKESKWYFEGIVDLALVEPKRKTRFHPRHNGHDAMAERGHVNIEIAKRLDKAAGKRDLLLGLA